MVTRKRDGLLPVTVTLDPIDVDLLDRLAALEGENRSSELRSLLLHLRPMIQQTVTTFEAAVRQRQLLDEAAAAATVSELEAIAPEVDELSRKVLGIVSRLEGAQAASSSDPRPSNHGGHTPTPLSDPDELEGGRDA